MHMMAHIRYAFVTYLNVILVRGASGGSSCCTIRINSFRHLNSSVIWQNTLNEPKSCVAVINQGPSSESNLGVEYRTSARTSA
ncbi:hypothetical protein EDB19DRAFT_1684118 [Suillus lakei]|nr:hypothetical protein EDB19DRAFT_1684118 [Suillus lakei]